MSIYKLAKPFLFRMEPERAHAIAFRFMPLLGDLRFHASSLRVKISIGELSNPVGLAAGFDKTGEHLETLEKLGFGYLVAGTVTKPPWPGHPKPRVVRNPKDKALVNALGFPNPGIDKFIQNISKKRLSVPLVGSISGQTIPDIIECYRKLQPHVSAIELNLSSPNTAKLRDLREIEPFKSLAEQMAPIKVKPTYLKIPPYDNDQQFGNVLQLVRKWDDLGFDGVTASNALLIPDTRLSIGTGGLSGPALFQKTLKAIHEIRRIVPGRFEIHSVGGISRSQDVILALSEGANTVQILTALIYEGPTLIRTILTELAERSEVSAVAAVK